MVEYVSRPLRIMPNKEFLYIHVIFIVSQFPYIIDVYQSQIQ